MDALRWSRSKTPTLREALSPVASGTGSSLVLVAGVVAVLELLGVRRVLLPATGLALLAGVLVGLAVVAVIAALSPERWQLDDRGVLVNGRLFPWRRAAGYAIDGVRLLISTHEGPALSVECSGALRDQVQAEVERRLSPVSVAEARRSSDPLKLPVPSLAAAVLGCAVAAGWGTHAMSSRWAVLAFLSAWGAGAAFAVGARLRRRVGRVSRAVRVVGVVVFFATFELSVLFFLAGRARAQG